MIYQQIIEECNSAGASLIAVSKTKSNGEILKIYNRGQRHFGENRVQELVEKYESLPKDILWHLIGHLQTNKVKYIAPFVFMIHSIDSLDLLSTVNKEAAKCNRIIPILLQIKIAQEDTKFGLNYDESIELLTSIKNGNFPNVSLMGLMGMASFTDDETQISSEFKLLSQLRDEWSIQFNMNLPELSIGMSSDYALALVHGSTMIRVGSLLFGTR